MQVKYFICYLQIPHILFLSDHQFRNYILSLLCILSPKTKYHYDMSTKGSQTNGTVKVCYHYLSPANKNIQI